MSTVAHILLSLVLVLSVGQQTLCEAVRKNGSTGISVLVEYAPLELSDLAKGADLVIRGRIVGEKPRLSRDEQSVVTDVTVQVLDVFRSGKTVLVPGSNLIVIKPGGTITLEGHLVRVHENDFPPFQLGEEYFLFLADRVGGLEVYGGGQGAFRVDGSEVRQASRAHAAWQEKNERIDVAAFLAQLTDSIQLRK